MITVIAIEIFSDMVAHRIPILVQSGTLLRIINESATIVAVLTMLGVIVQL